MDANRLDRRKRTALHNAVLGGVSVEHIKILIDWGVNVNAQDEDGSTILHLAVQDERLVVTSLLRFIVQDVRGVDFNLANNANDSPFTAACRVGNSAAAIFLMDSDTTLYFSQLEPKYQTLRPAIQHAIKYDRLPAIENMVKLGYFDFEGDMRGENAILSAANSEAYDCLSYLVVTYPGKARQALREASIRWSGSDDATRILEATMLKHNIVTEGVADGFREWVEKQPK